MSEPRDAEPALRLTSRTLLFRRSGGLGSTGAWPKMVIVRSFPHSPAALILRTASPDPQRGRKSPATSAGGLQTLSAGVGPVRKFERCCALHRCLRRVAEIDPGTRLTDFAAACVPYCSLFHASGSHSRSWQGFPDPPRAQRCAASVAELRFRRGAAIEYPDCTIAQKIPPMNAGPPA